MYFALGLLFPYHAISFLPLLTYGSILKKHRDASLQIAQPIAIALAIFGTLLCVIYATEFIAALTSDSQYEFHQPMYRTSRSHAWVFWLTLIGTGILPLLLFIPRIRRILWGISVIDICANGRLLLERFNTFLLHQNPGTNLSPFW